MRCGHSTDRHAGTQNNRWIASLCSSLHSLLFLTFPPPWPPLLPALLRPPLPALPVSLPRATSLVRTSPKPVLIKHPMNDLDYSLFRRSESHWTCWIPLLPDYDNQQPEQSINYGRRRHFSDWIMARESFNLDSHKSSLIASQDRLLLCHGKTCPNSTESASSAQKGLSLFQYGATRHSMRGGTLQWSDKNTHNDRLSSLPK